MENLVYSARMIAQNPVVEMIDVTRIVVIVWNVSRIGLVHTVQKSAVFTAYSLVLVSEMVTV